MEKKPRKTNVKKSIKPNTAENEEKVINPWDAMWGIGIDRSDEVEVEHTEEDRPGEEKDNDNENEDKERNFWFNW
ncbi:hypothetical protein [Pseudalkalibacillus berkeleyi]|uniref:Uncharacterized protein n=1 Tax=Pseudalkalibacillus berkeleyi TaxID=1069813 RepID=A0ABS9H025_9BACL|nr:hypothetical protein [Pseudalkalibacillus berkeleyi]MCF6137366.1 hypothetical protein [Pseudalkalibacillus berkeleyi]